MFDVLRSGTSPATVHAGATVDGIPVLFIS